MTLVHVSLLFGWPTIVSVHYHKERPAFLVWGVMLGETSVGQTKTWRSDVLKWCEAPDNWTSLLYESIQSKAENLNWKEMICWCELCEYEQRWKHAPRSSTTHETAQWSDRMIIGSIKEEQWSSASRDIIVHGTLTWIYNQTQPCVCLCALDTHINVENEDTALVVFWLRNKSSTFRH